MISTNPLTLDFVDMEPEDGYNNYVRSNSGGGKKNKKGRKVDFDDISELDSQHSKRGSSPKSKKHRKKDLDFEDYY